MMLDFRFVSRKTRMGLDLVELLVFFSMREHKTFLLDFSLHLWKGKFIITSLTPIHHHIILPHLLLC